MPTFLDTYNPSILAIPAYYILSVLPHTYAINIATQGKPRTWDNRNPRSSSLKSHLKETLDAETYAYYERAEACHANGMENLPLFASAVILGNMAGLKQDGIHGLTGFAGLFLVIRVAYTVVYLRAKTRGPTVVRSALWATGSVLCVRVMLEAARVVGKSKVMG